MAENTETGQIRLDKWLWHARFFKSRSIASTVCKARKVRIDGTVAEKASATVRPGQVLTFPQGAYIRVVKVLAPGVRRGPAAEAQSLYEDLSPVDEQKESVLAEKKSAVAVRETGAGRPTKAERRATDKLRGRD
ncbi:RNA-binding S4 domain-containing protein [Kordiimonas gwangyangensis]|uniref:RNA-binding S4 domain-containing protein n=1 Tax=Kordiimonas gwangyangensis TaxID=288022 RepID=UPI0003643846|nr:RNA-binding S4 domain-containing protein [Kordiimonas gwangyangensis]